jgi:hypothetical protein
MYHHHEVAAELARQRRQDLLGQAANRRLVRLARASAQRHPVSRRSRFSLSFLRRQLAAALSWARPVASANEVRGD